jgi:hypothetical protein
MLKSLRGFNAAVQRQKKKNREGGWRPSVLSFVVPDISNSRKEATVREARTGGGCLNGREESLSVISLTPNRTRAFHLECRSEIFDERRSFCQRLLYLNRGLPGGAQSTI